MKITLPDKSVGAVAATTSNDKMHTFSDDGTHGSLNDNAASIDAGVHFWDVDNSDNVIFIEEDLFSDYNASSFNDDTGHIEFDLELGDVFDFDFSADGQHTDNTVDVLLAQGADFNTIASSIAADTLDSVDMVVFGANSHKIFGETMNDLFSNLDGVQRCTHDKVSVDDAAWTKGNSEHNLGGKTYVEFTNENDVSILVAKTSLEINTA